MPLSRAGLKPRSSPNTSLSFPAYASVLSVGFTNKFPTLARSRSLTVLSLSLSSTCLLSTDNCLLTAGWSYLPTPVHLGGSDSRWGLCAGCLQPLRNLPHWQCSFSRTGFRLRTGFTCPPCQVSYHHGCIRVGHPFRSRFRDPKEGLSMPRHTSQFPYVCELCTGTATLGRSLRPTSTDEALLMLERMRQIDLAHSWAPKTLATISRELKRFYDFQRSFALPPVGPQSPQCPPSGTSIQLLWLLEWRTTQPSPKEGYDFITFSGAQSVRSALSALHTWAFAHQASGTAFHAPSKHTFSLAPLGLAATDDLITHLTTQGMMRRLGTEARPPLAVKAEHVRFNIAARRREFHSTFNLAVRLRLALANLCELTFWLGWLRSNEVFSLCWVDVEWIDTSRAPTFSLPSPALLFRLLESTKTNRSKQADVIVASRTASGLDIGYWFCQARHLAGTHSRDPSLIFQTLGRPWTSHSFRTHSLLPLWEEQRLQGDPTFRPYSGPAPNTLRHRLYSMGSFRRGARTHVSRHRAGCLHAASAEEILEHGRWRTRNVSAPSVSPHYNEPSLEDRLYITLLCM